MLKGYMTTAEAAEHLEYNPDYICYLCKKGNFQGAEKFGNKMWAIPEQSVIEYKKNGQGFAAVKARKEAQEASMWAEINAAIRAAHFPIPATA